MRHLCEFELELQGNANKPSKRDWSEILNKVAKSLPASSRNNLWQYLFFVLIPFFAYLGSRNAQCCDTQAYISESQSLRNGGFDFYSSWLSLVHNYCYPTFLALLGQFGLVTRSQIAVTQGIILSIAGIYLAAALEKKLAPSGVFARHVSLLVFLILCAYAFSGYNLTEALEIPLILSLLASILNLSTISTKTTRLNSVLQKTKIMPTIYSGFLWMLRPALIWVSLVIFIWIMRQVIFVDKKKIVSNLALNVFCLLIIITPQLLSILKIRGSVFSNFFKLGLSALQTTASGSMARYATNLSGCGSPRWIFPSPQTLFSPKQSLGTISKVSLVIVNYFLHLVSGWDALPAPSYVEKISLFPWIIVTLFSGFFIFSSFKYIAVLVKEVQIPKRDFQWIDNPKILLVILFILSQIFIINTATEFRYNIIGWIFALIFFFFLQSNEKFGIRREFVIKSILISFVIFVIGQLTLISSPIWTACLH